MKARTIIFTVIAVCLTSCSTPKNAQVAKYGFPRFGQNGKIAVVAHRGYWKCDEGGYSENSLAAFRAAANAGFWGCELDVHLTADGQLLVNHDGTINGKEIETHNLADFDNDLLPNGEKHPTLDEYLSVAEKIRTTKLVIEFKGESEAMLDEAVRLLRKHGMLSPKRVVFIAFGRSICEKTGLRYPGFCNQYLNGGMEPGELARLGINGIDYGFWEFRDHPEWVSQAHRFGMSVNCWTVDYDGIVDEMVLLGVDAITTNEPMMVRNQLGAREFTLKK